jgi:hypothetical protein
MFKVRDDLTASHAPCVVINAAWRWSDISCKGMNICFGTGQMCFITSILLFSLVDSRLNSAALVETDQLSMLKIHHDAWPIMISRRSSISSRKAEASLG